MSERTVLTEYWKLQAELFDGGAIDTDERADLWSNIAALLLLADTMRELASKLDAIAAEIREIRERVEG